MSKTKRHGGANYTTLTQGQAVKIDIPADAVINPNIGGYRAVTFDVSLRTNATEPNRFRFTCFSDIWQPGDTIVGRLKLGSKQMMQHPPKLYARIDARHDLLNPTHILGLVDDEKGFARERSFKNTSAFAFPRENEIGGVILRPI